MAIDKQQLAELMNLTSGDKQHEPSVYSLHHTYHKGTLTYLRTGIQQNHTSRHITFAKLYLEREGRDAVVVTVASLLDRILAAVADLDVIVLYGTSMLGRL